MVGFLSTLTTSMILVSVATEAFMVGDHRLATPFGEKGRTTFQSKDHSPWSLSMSEEKDPLDEFSDERKANLFQFLLRDFEVEGCPLLGCDADQAHTVQAALWTTMAELNEKDEENKACLVLENIPVDALRTLVDDFVVLKTQTRLMDYLPELSRFSLSLVGKGVGPAIIIETEERSEEQKASYNAMKQSCVPPDEFKGTAAMKAFVSRMVVGNQVCPFTKDNAVAPVGLENMGVQPGPIAYRLVGSPDICDTLSAFWTSICELLAMPPEQLSSTVLCFPAVPEGSDASEAHGRFEGLAEIISRTLFLFRGEEVFELLHMHPLYDRDLIHPKDKPAHGHLPPVGWLRAMMEANGDDDEAANLTDEELTLQNYQRRSPLPAVVIKRVSQLDAAATPKSGIVQLDLGDGRIELASGLDTYSRNTIHLAREGREVLEAAVKDEVNLLK